MNNIHPELIYQYATTSDEKDALEILQAIVAYFLSIYDAERELFLENNGIDLPLSESDEVRIEFMMYITDVLIGMRLRTLEKIEKEQATKGYMEKAAIYTFVSNAFNTIKETDSVNAQQIAQIEVVKKVQQTMPNARVFKTWISQNDEATCPICRAMHGTKIPVDEPFLVNGQVVELADGDEFIYNYINRSVAIAHPRDRCRIDFSIEY